LLLVKTGTILLFSSRTGCFTDIDSRWHVSERGLLNEQCFAHYGQQLQNVSIHGPAESIFLLQSIILCDLRLVIRAKDRYQTSNLVSATHVATITWALLIQWNVVGAYNLGGINPWS
jgi:hypothetical protein